MSHIRKIGGQLIDVRTGEVLDAGVEARKQRAARKMAWKPPHKPKRGVDDLTLAFAAYCVAVTFILFMLL